MINLFDWSWWQPEPPLTVSQWADKYRIISKDSGSSEPGPWKTSRTLYAKFPMDCFSSREIEEITICSSTQTFKTELILNCIGYVIDYDPDPMLVVLPREDDLAPWGLKRFLPMLRDTPNLKAHLTGKRNDTAGKIWQLDRMWIRFASSAAPADLSMMPARYVFLDEMDKFKEYSGKEANPISLAKDRTTTYQQWRKIIKTSTTTTEEGYIWQELKKSLIHRFHVPCPYCWEYQTLNFFPSDEGGLKGMIWWPEGFTADEILGQQLARYRCAACGELIEHHHKEKMLVKGIWAQEGCKIEKDGSINGPIRQNRHVGFHINALYSPWLSWSFLVAEYLSIKDEPSKLMGFFNSRLALPWKEQMKETKPEFLYDRREKYDKLPAGVLFLSAGVDLQDEWMAIEVVGWGKNYESWSIDYQIIQGSPGNTETWDQLEQYLFRPFEHILGFKMQIEAVGLDTGGHYTQEAYAFARNRANRKVARIYAIKGANTDTKEIVSKQRRTSVGTLILHIVGVSLAKRIIYNRLGKGEPGPGYMHFPERDNYDLGYFQGLTAEHYVRKIEKGKVKKFWVVKGRNEPIDARVYAFAALLIRFKDYPPWDKMQKYIQQLAEQQVKLSEPQDEEMERLDPLPKEPPFIQRKGSHWPQKGGGFITNW